jgi:hypothetical protein
VWRRRRSTGGHAIRHAEHADRLDALTTAYDCPRRRRRHCLRDGPGAGRERLELSDRVKRGADAGVIRRLDRPAALRPTQRDVEIGAQKDSPAVHVEVVDRWPALRKPRAVRIRDARAWTCGLLRTS